LLIMTKRLCDMETMRVIFTTNLIDLVLGLVLRGLLIIQEPMTVGG
jgi:hypothetical protein